MSTKSPTGHTKRIVPVTDRAIQAIGQVSAPSTTAIITELKLAIAMALYDLRSWTGEPKARAQTIGALTRSIRDLVAIGQLEELGRLDLSAMSDADLKEHADKLLRSLN